jgi:hypothetical protein
MEFSYAHTIINRLVLRSGFSSSPGVSDAAGASSLACW